MEFSKLLKNNEDNEGKKEEISMIFQLQQDISDFGQPIVNLSNKHSIEATENKVNEINERNEKIFSKMGVEAYIHKIIHFDEYTLLQAQLDENKDIKGDINSVNILALKLLDGEKFSKYLKYLETLSLKYSGDYSDIESIVRFYKEVEQNGDNTIFDLVSDNLFKKFDFYIDKNQIDEPNDSLFELMKNGDKIVEAYRSSGNEQFAEKMEDTILSLKNGYYKEYSEFSSAPGSFRSVGIKFRAFSLKKIKESEIAKAAAFLGFKDTWNEDDEFGSSIEFCREHFNDLLKISENSKAIEDKIFTREIKYYLDFFSKSLEVSKLYYDEKIDDKFQKNFNGMLAMFIDRITLLHDKNKTSISEAKNNEIQAILDEAKQLVIVL